MFAEHRPAKARACVIVWRADTGSQIFVSGKLSQKRAQNPDAELWVIWATRGRRGASLEGTAQMLPEMEVRTT